MIIRLIKKMVKMGGSQNRYRNALADFLICVLLLYNPYTLHKLKTLLWQLTDLKLTIII